MVTKLGSASSLRVLEAFQMEKLKECCVSTMHRGWKGGKRDRDGLDNPYRIWCHRHSRIDGLVLLGKVASALRKQRHRLKDEGYGMTSHGM